jgi:hypothetical protein
MFIAFSRILYCFDFEEYPDAPIDEYRINPLAHDHAPFKVKTTPRSPEQVRLIEEGCSELGKELETLA